MTPAVIWDFHGTLADVSPVLHFLDTRDFDGFYEGSLSCPPNPLVAQEARRTHEAGFVNLLFTGMSDRYAEGLNDWLQRHGVPVGMICMRTAQDRYAKDFIVKKRMYLEAVERGYYMVRAWEDRPSVADLWNSLGVPVVFVSGFGENLTIGQVDKQSATP